MKAAFPVEAVRAAEAMAIANGSTVAELMERAGTALANAALHRAAPHGRFLVLCGPGHNGGDGFVAARLLRRAGRQVNVEVVAPGSLSQETSRQRELLGGDGPPLDAGEPWGPGDVAIDALLGVGLTRPPDSLFATAIYRLRELRARGVAVVAADVPSGLAADSGIAYEPTVRADATVTFGALKLGLLGVEGSLHAGEVTVAGIDLPLPTNPGHWLLQEASVKEMVPALPRAAHKGTSGHVLVLAGSRDRAGAAAIACLGALRGGAGLVTLACREEVRRSVVLPPEVMVAQLSGAGPLGLEMCEELWVAMEGKRALVVGPGIHRGPETSLLIERMLAERPCPMVLDADGLNALSELPECTCRGELLLTPHPGEAQRLLKEPIPADIGGRIRAAQTLGKRYQAAVLLKGARTIIAGGRNVYVNPTGNPGLATGGTGDVLAGLAGALLGQGHCATNAGVIAAFIHGLAADLAVARTGERGLLASEVATAIGAVWARWRK